MNQQWECRGDEDMSHILSFIGGALLGGVLGVVMMCCFIVSGEESRREEKYLGGKQNTSPDD